MSFPYEIVERRLAVEILRYSEPMNQWQLFSPFSIAFIITMLWLASAEETREEIAEMLAPDVPLELYTSKIMATSFALFNNRINPPVVLLSHIYVDSRIQVASRYQEELAKYFDNQLHYYQFYSSDQAMKTLNEAAANSTHSKITDVVPFYTFDNERIVLVSGLYYKVALRCGVLKSDYINVTFHSTPYNTREVLMISRICESEYYEDSEIQVIKLEMRTISTSLYMFLPKFRFALPAFEADLSALKLDVLMKSCKRRFIAVTFPKFNFTGRMNFNKPLMKAGLIEPFVRTAQFPRINIDPIYITAAFHKTVVESEEVSPEVTTAPVPDYVKEPHFRGESVFFADHPFLFLIMHEKSVLVMGRYT